jgi:23S rRNA pseudouridine2605 synthase
MEKGKTPGKRPRTTGSKTGAFKKGPEKGRSEGKSSFERGGERSSKSNRFDEKPSGKRTSSTGAFKKEGADRGSYGERSEKSYSKDRSTGGRERGERSERFDKGSDSDKRKDYRGNKGSANSFKRSTGPNGSLAPRKDPRRSSSEEYGRAYTPDDEQPARKTSRKRDDEETKPFRSRTSTSPAHFKARNEIRKNDKPTSRKTGFSQERPERRSFRKEEGDGEEKAPYSSKTRTPSSFDKRPERKPAGGRGRETSATSRKPFAKKASEKDYLNTAPSADRYAKHKKFEEGEHPAHLKSFKKKPFQKFKTEKFEAKENLDDDGNIRLNKYIANAGICSRREADQLITSGVIAVNGKTITELGYKIKPTDSIQYGGHTLTREKLVYILINKPKDYITTTDDPKERKTILHLIQGACRERVYPVGRLDRASTGVLLLTNDGELTKRLTHPRYEKKKIYHVYLDKALKAEDMKAIREGITLEDGEVTVDDISFVAGTTSKKEVGIELHSGKNRIIRRIFESLGYDVIKLDRVYFSGLTKKDLPRGKWRFLSEKEVNMLKMSS